MIAENILHETQTPLERYLVVERTYEGRPARVLFSGQRRAAQSGIGLDDDPDLLFDYNQRLLELSSGLYPKRILIIGGGAFTLPMALVATLPEAHIDVVELDPGLEPIARQYFGLVTSERLHIVFGDGRQFIATTKTKYDLIILDVFNELSIPHQFLTSEFIKQVPKRLKPKGGLAMNIIASLQGRNTGLIKSQVAAYQVAFKRLTIFPAAYGLSGWLPQNLILFAQKQADQQLDAYVRFAPIVLPQAEVDDMYHDEASTIPVALP